MPISSQRWVPGVRAAAVAAAFLAVSALVGWLAWHEDLQIPGIAEGTSAPAKVTYLVSATGADFSVEVHTPPDHLVEGKAGAASILIANSTGRDLNIPVSWYAPGFEFKFHPDLKPRNDAKNQAICCFLPVPAFQTVTLELLATPVASEGSHPITLIFWNDAGAKAPTKSVAYIAPIRFTSLWQVHLYRLFFLISAFIRALAVPVVLAGVAYWFNERSKERETEAKNRQDQRDKDAKIEQDARDRRNSILTTRIPEYSKIVQEHYLPIARRGDTLESEMLPGLKDPKQWPLIGGEIGHLMPNRPEPNESPNDLWRLLCAILLYRARLLKLFLAGGGIYFRSNQAERLFADLINQFFGRLYHKLGKERFSEAVALLDPDDLFSRALIQCSTTGEFAKDPDKPSRQIEIERNLERFRALFVALKDWIVDDPADFRAYTRLVQLSSRILDFECDRPFYQTGPYRPGGDTKEEADCWYFDPPQLGFEAEHYEIPESLRDALDPSIREYIENVPQVCRSDEFPKFPR